MKIVVITDAHANLAALEAALTAIQAEGYDLLVHTGDAIAIGPYPAECLDLLLHTPNARFLMGNHERYAVEGLPTPRPAWMSDGEVQHQHWTHARLDAPMRTALAAWPLVLTYEFEGVRIALMHYALDPSGQDFQPVVQNAAVSDLDTLFVPYDAAIIFYGHDHSASDIQGRARYINPGSLGCYSQAVARYCVVEFHSGEYHIEQRGVPYDDDALYRTFEQRHVPERAFIYRAFFGGRF
jgi:putative phosphoesterase